MNRSILIASVAVISLLSIAVLSVGTPPASAETGIAPLRATQASTADAEATLNAACATCHDLTAVQPGLYTTAEWQETINRMLGYGATLTEEQTAQILAYLATDAPAGAEGGAADPAEAQALLNSSCTTCHDLTAVQPGLYTAAEWTDTINRMLGYGATVTEDQMTVLVNYLATDAGDSGGGEVDPAAAQALLNSSCATCHDLTAVQPGLYTAAEWTETINRMLGYGASVTDSEMNLLLDYLATDR